jgi:hypothetical protein
MTRKKQRLGGKREGAGRKARDGAVHLIRRNVTLTPEQARKLSILGGSLWLRFMIDREFDKED